MYYCGWDGGGTMTSVCIIDENNNIISQATFGPININGSSSDIIIQTINDCINFMSQVPGGLDSCAGLVIGAAGINNTLLVDIINKTIRGSAYSGPYKLVGDQEIALYGAVSSPGCILIAGTGSVCYGKDENGTPFQCGGYGYLIDDRGSGYAIGLDILTAIVHSFDGRGPKTILRKMVFSKLNLEDNIDALITWTYSPTTDKHQIASLAPLLSTAAEQNDAVAINLSKKTASDLAELVITAWKKANMLTGEIALIGSITNYHPVIKKELIKILKNNIPEAIVVSPKGEPCYGAALLAKEMEFKK